MGYDLISQSGACHQWKSVGWWYLLNLARSAGWEPTGTIAPAGVDAEEWDGNYFRNDGQMVTAGDAEGLADALARLLEDPERRSKADGIGRRMDLALADGGENAAGRYPDVITYPLEFFRGMLKHFGQVSVGRWSCSEENERYLRDFIAFCRGGAFRIT
jgi:hypothetical protein